MIEQLSVFSVTFNLTAMAAVNKERCLANQKDTEVHDFLAVSHINENEAVITVSYCTHCKMNYHIIKTCHDLHSELKKAAAEKRKQCRRNNNKCQQSNSIYEPAIETINLMAVEKTSMNLPQIWVIDTDCSQHVICQCENFVDYQNLLHHSAVRGIRGVELCVMRWDTVKLCCHVKGKLTDVKLFNVIYCSAIGVNLISVSQLLKCKAQISFDNSECKVTVEPSVLTGIEQDGLFVLKL